MGRPVLIILLQEILGHEEVCVVVLGNRGGVHVKGLAAYSCAQFPIAADS